MITIKAKNDEFSKKIILDNLIDDNKKRCDWFNRYSSTFNENYDYYVYDDDKLIGGVVGYILYEWYFIDLLWVDKEYRGKSIGSSLIKKVEDYVQKEKLVGIRLETWDFQAKEFYEKLGYTIYATLNDCPPGTTNYFFMKKYK